MSSTWNAWLGKHREALDLVSPAPLRMMAATLDLDADGIEDTPIRPLWHWLYFLPAEQQSSIGHDGHVRRGGFLPPIELPRRMWAGGRLTFHRPLRCGTRVRRVSRIDRIEEKTGRTGALVFVTVSHEILDTDGLAIHEEQDIVYRAPAAGGAPVAAVESAPGNAQFSRLVTPDPVLLFRYSALTFNGHRIHYDRSYVTLQEGYPGLVVHGPLIATLLLEELQREQPDTRIASFAFKANSPLFDTASFEVCGRIDANMAHLWARGPQGQLAMQASARLV